MTRQTQRPFEILLVEDNPGDVKLFTLLLEHTEIQYKLNVLCDGEAASEYLLKDVPAGRVSRPDFIVLDLNLPKKDGREILKGCKQHPTVGGIPILVLTTSEDEQDIRRCYELHANCYVTKPFDLSRFNSVMKGIESFWFGLAEIPQFRKLSR